MLDAVGMREGEAIESRHAVARRSSARSARSRRTTSTSRKNLLEYDDVANDQRKVIYQQRTELMAAEDIGDWIAGIRDEVRAGSCASTLPPDSVEEQWDVAGLEQDPGARFRRAGLPTRRSGWTNGRPLSTRTAIARRVIEAS